jgi:hypothetical protein
VQVHIHEEREEDADRYSIVRNVTSKKSCALDGSPGCETNSETETARARGKHLKL